MLQAAELIGRTAERVGPSVVGLGRGWGRGCGVIVAPGRILTNAHVLRGRDVAVRVGDMLVQGAVAGVDPRADLAVIAADTGAAPAVAWDPERLQRVGIGTPVLALADPGGRGLRVSAGHVTSAVRRAVEHTAPLPAGSSGGPLVDADGALLGLNTVRTEGGLILALPADAAMRSRADALARGDRRATRPRLGVALTPGLTVRAVLDASPAAVAGLRPGDRLVAAADRPLRTVDDLLDALEAGGELVLTVERDGAQRDVAVPL
jgi:serine protease Do